MEAIYNFDFGRLAKLLLPTFLRKPILTAWLSTAISPLYGLKTTFLEHKREINYILTHTPQVCYLQAAVNDAIDMEIRRVRIMDTERHEHILFYRREDKKDVAFYRVFDDNAVVFHRRGLIGKEAVDFVVEVPGNLLSNKQNQIIIKSIINQYKLASKRYLLKSV